MSVWAWVALCVALGLAEAVLAVMVGKWLNRRGGE